MIYARMNFSRIKKTHGIELSKIQGGFALLVLTSFIAFVFNVIMIISSLAVIHIYGYWPMSNTMCQSVGFLSNIGEIIFVNSSFTIIIFRNIIIFKDLGSKICQKIYKSAIKQNSLMILVICILWTYSILIFYLSIVLNEFEVGFTKEHCNVVFTDQTQIFNVYFCYTVFSFIPLVTIAYVTTILSFVGLKRKSLNLNVTSPPSVSLLFTIKLISMMTLGLSLQLTFPQLPPFTGKVLASAYHWMVTAFVSTSTWPFIRLAMVTVFKDVFCVKPRKDGDGNDILSATFSA